jgi:hypothetical protein
LSFEVVFMAREHTDHPRQPDESAGSAPTDVEKDQSLDLKKRIEEAKRRHDMPVDSNLGNPDWEERAADGHLDISEEDDQ